MFGSEEKKLILLSLNQHFLGKLSLNLLAGHVINAGTELNVAGDLMFSGTSIVPHVVHAQAMKIPLAIR